MLLSRGEVLMTASFTLVRTKRASDFAGHQVTGQMATLGPRKKKKPPRPVRAEQAQRQTCGLRVAMAELSWGASVCLETRGNEERRKPPVSSRPVARAQQAELCWLCRPLPTKEQDKFRASSMHCTPTWVLEPSTRCTNSANLMKSTKATAVQIKPLQDQGSSRQACLSSSLLYVMGMHQPKLHESFTQSNNRNLKSSLASPATDTSNLLSWPAWPPVGLCL